jgi:cell division FtsZ-interacting protein ZapD
MLYMPDTIRVNADTKHLIAIAAIWKSPDLLRLLFYGGVCAFDCPAVLLLLHGQQRKAER